jgi:hypothetical protein
VESNRGVKQQEDLVLILTPCRTVSCCYQRETIMFKGFDEYDSITRLVFDLETTALEPKDGRIFMIGIKTNKGFSEVIECADDPTKKEKAL